jgi:arylsulfatase A-like enzyme
VTDDYYGPRARTYVTDRYKLTTYPGKEYGELFDLDADPDELFNRWDDPEYADVRAQLYEAFLDAYVRDESCLPRKPSSWA